MNTLETIPIVMSLFQNRIPILVLKLIFVLPTKLY